MNQEERDMLIRIDANLSNLVEQVDYHRKDFKIHIEKDEKEFEKTNDKIGWLQKIVFMGLGALALLRIFFK